MKVIYLNMILKVIFIIFDMTLYDRKYEFNNKNLSLCEINCTFKGCNENTSTVQCECIQKQGLNRLNNSNDNLINKLENNKNILNIDVIQCTDILNNSEDLKNSLLYYYYYYYFSFLF